MADAQRRNWWAVWRWALHWQILLGLLVGIGLAVLTSMSIRDGALRQAATEIAAQTGEGVETVLRRMDRPEASVELKQKARGLLSARTTGRVDFETYRLLGDIFMNALRMIIVPIVMSSLIVAVAQMGSAGDFARLGGKTLAYYITTSLLAILTGLLAVNLVTPGVVEPGKPCSAWPTRRSLPGSFPARCRM